MSLLTTLLDTYIFSGIPSNATWDVIKLAWAKAQEKDWEDLYLESFQKTINDTQSILAKYSDGSGDIALPEAELERILRSDLHVDPASLSFGTLTDDQFAARLSQAMVERSVLVIGGHNLSDEDYAQLARNLVQQAKARFKEAILANEPAFRRAVLEETQATQSGVGEVHTVVGQVQAFLVERFDLTLDLLDEIRGDVKGIAADVNEIKKRLPPTPAPIAAVSTTPKVHRGMISSTARDLPDHRQEVMNACMRMSMFHPEMMEHLTATDANAKQVSLRMVEQADLYIGVFAFRYGYVPNDDNPAKISVTEMEYQRAVERGIPRLIFLMSDDHPVRPSDVETGAGAEKLRKLKERLKTERVVGFFKSADDLRAQVIQALVPYREADLTTFHYVSDIPQPPEMYVAHPYTLLQTGRLVGRQAELNLLTDWVTGPKEKPGVLKTPGFLTPDVWQARILNIVAIGGMGKSALTWIWFNEIAPQEMKPLAGRMWWSFYESDATFENFVIRALAYVSRRSREEIQKLAPPDREEQLLAALDREPFLLVLDGLERILIAYARMDAARLSDDDFDQQTANVVAGAIGLPAGAEQSFTGQHRLRKTADPRVGTFLRKLAQVRAARILVSTRLYPAELQGIAGAPLPGCAAKFLEGLSDDDALNLWRTFGVSGSREALLPLFNSFGRHPLLLQALAGEVATDRRAPGDFDAWRQAHTDFNPFNLPLIQARTHVLEFALRGLDDKARRVLQTVAAFRMPAGYDTLAALFVASPLSEEDQDEGRGEGEPKLFATEPDLDATLNTLEDRGLLGWDRRANRYDLHPLVRGVVWSGLPDQTRTLVFTALQTHFEAVPQIENYLEVNSLEDLSPAIELYHTLIGLGRYDDAGRLFYERIDEATLYRLSASRQRAELLELLFPDGMDQLPRLSDPARQAFTLNALALAYDVSGEPGRAAPLFRRQISIREEEGNLNSVSIGLGNLSYALRLAGTLRESEVAARRALAVNREQGYRFNEAVSLYLIGLTLAARGGSGGSGLALQRALRIRISERNGQGEGLISSYLAQRALWQGEPVAALPPAERAWELAHYARHERDFIRAARVQGAALVQTCEVSETSQVSAAKADERLHHALSRARAINLGEEELPALVALAELRRRQGQEQAARDLLDEVWEAAERGPYPLFHADAYNVLAQIERDAGNQEKAVEAATQAYRLAWCDGPPFAYHWGLVTAQQHLAALGAAEPSLPPFDESRYEPMVEVEIDPEDEFHVGEK